MKRDDLRVKRPNALTCTQHMDAHREVTEPEFEALAILWAKKIGFVRRPVCDKCEGGGSVCLVEVEPYCREADHLCPSCGGSGFGRLYVECDHDEHAMDIDGERFVVPDGPRCNGFVLAALDQEDTP